MIVRKQQDSYYKRPELKVGQKIIFHFKNDYFHILSQTWLEKHARMMF